MKSTLMVAFSLCAVAITPSYSTMIEHPTADSTLVSSIKTIKQHVEEGQVIAIVESIDRFEVNAANLALSKDIDQPVKIFAHYLTYHHLKNLEKLKALAFRADLISSPSAKLIAIDLENNATIKKLTQLNGNAFSVEYVNDMVKGHQAVLKLIDADLFQSISDPALKKFVQHFKVSVKHHLNKALKLQRKLRLSAND